MPLATVFLPAQGRSNALNERDVRSFFSRFENEVELRILEPSRKPLGTQLQAVLPTTQGQILFVLESDLTIPLAEVLSWVSEFNEKPNLQALFANRWAPRKKLPLSPAHAIHTSTATAADPLAKILSDNTKALFTDAALPDPLCHFFALRRDALAALQSTHGSRWFLTQAVALSLKPTEWQVRGVQHTKAPARLGLWEFMRAQWELRTLAKRYRS